MSREEIFVYLLEKALRLLCKDGGLLFTQIPVFNTDAEISRKFWDEYIAKKKIEGYDFLFTEDGDPNRDKVFAVRRNQKIGV